MTTISDIQKKYASKIDFLDLEVLLAHVLNKSREFVLTHPEHILSKFQISNFKFQISRRLKNEPIAYIIEHKEFYGLDFAVNNHTLVPRPETELLVDLALQEIRSAKHKTQTVIDVGTGSGNIIVSLAHELTKTGSCQLSAISCCAIDISKEALKVARKNARKHSVNQKIEFIEGDLLSPFIQNSKFKIQNSKMIILANLPYLSKEIYQSAPIDVKNFEPKTALYSPKAGLAHYAKLLEQVRKISESCELKTVSCILEISPEQKKLLPDLIKKTFPLAKIKFFKDLAGKWRICKIELV